MNAQVLFSAALLKAGLQPVVKNDTNQKASFSWASRLNGFSHKDRDLRATQ
jgi:hypothetical protein